MGVNEMSKLICLDCVKQGFHSYLWATLTFFYGLLNFLSKRSTLRA